MSPEALTSNETIVIQTFDEYSETFEAKIAGKVSLLLQSFGGVLEALLLIAFVKFLFLKSLKSLRGFIVLLGIGYLIDFIALACWGVSTVYNFQNQFWVGAAEMSFIYVIISGSLWNTIFSLNRCVAVLWPTKHSKYWSTKYICLIYAPAILLYPFILQGHLLSNSKFYEEGLSIFSASTSFFFVSRLIIGISNTIMAVIMLLGTLWVYRRCRKSSILLTHRWDLNMLIHCAFQSFFMFLFSLGYQLAAVFFPNYPIASFACEYLGQLSHGIFHYGGIITLLFINSTIRKAVINFYTCSIFSRRGSMKVTTYPQITILYRKPSRPLNF